MTNKPDFIEAIEKQTNNETIEENLYNACFQATFETMPEMDIHDIVKICTKTVKLFMKYQFDNECEEEMQTELEDRLEELK